MSKTITQLHSHSILEHGLELPKNIVLVDERFGEMFHVKYSLKYKKSTYYKVPIMDFIRNGGVFKAYIE